MSGEGRPPYGDDLEALFDGTDAPRPLPDELRARLEASLLAPHGGDELPRALRRRLERSMARTSLPAARSRVLAVAAALLLLVATTAVIVRTGSGGGGGDTVAGGAPRSPDGFDTAGGAGGGSSGGLAGDGDATGAPTGEVVGDEAAGGSGGGDSGVGGVAPGAAPPVERTQGAPASGAAGGPPPPFAYGDGSGEQSGGELGEAQDRAAGPPIRIGVVHGDHDLEAGFLAYLDVLEAQGGIGGRPVVVVATSPSVPARGTVATVNLSGAPLATEGVPSWVRPPLLENHAAPEGSLAGPVLSFTSVLERQAHLAGLAAFPQARPGGTAAIYHATSGRYADRVPAAIEEALRTRGVAAVRVPTDAAAPRFVPADAAFVSLPNGDAGPFLRAAAAGGYAPEQGLWGIGSLFDEELLVDAPPSLRVLSPYTLPGPNEADALRRGAARGLGTGVVHGWVTAKGLAVAMWQSGASTSAGVDDGLAALAGWSNGFMPPYEVRAGTRSRTPEGLVLIPRDGRYTAGSPFQRDRL